VIFTCGMGGGPTTTCHSSTEYCVGIGNGDIEASVVTYSCAPFPQGACNPASCDCVGDAGLSCFMGESCRVYSGPNATPTVTVLCAN
jgi:hypothetical protein